MVQTKDEWGTPDCQGYPDRTEQLWKKYFAKFGGTVQSGIQETGQVRNGVVSLSVGIFLTVQG